MMSGQMKEAWYKDDILTLQYRIMALHLSLAVPLMMENREYFSLSFLIKFSFKSTNRTMGTESRYSVSDSSNIG